MTTETTTATEVVETPSSDTAEEIYVICAKRNRSLPVYLRLRFENGKPDHILRVSQRVLAQHDLHKFVTANTGGRICQLKPTDNDIRIHVGWDTGCDTWVGLNDIRWPKLTDRVRKYKFVRPLRSLQQADRNDTEYAEEQDRANMLRVLTETNWNLEE